MSIIEISDSLLGAQTDNISTAVLRFRYLAFALPMRSFAGVRVEDTRSWYQLAPKGTLARAPRRSSMDPMNVFRLLVCIEQPSDSG
jgi:hypothetical protein